MLEFLQNLLYAILTAAIPVISAYAVKLLQKLFDKFSTETENSKLNETIYSAQNLIFQVVNSTSQTYVDSLKASGKFDEEAQKKAFEETKSRVMALLSDSSKEILNSMYSDLDQWIDIQIENAVKQNKNN